MFDSKPFNITFAMFIGMSETERIMPREKQAPIDNPDILNTSRSYWNRVLSSHGLSEIRGYRENFVAYHGSLNDLTGTEEQQFRLRTGKITRRGHGPDV